MFRPAPFISKLLGQGDLSGLMDKMEEVRSQNPEKQKELMKKLEEGGKFTIRDWKEQLGNVMGMGPLSKIAGMIPGMSQMFSGGEGDEAASGKMKRMMYICDSMTREELDSDGSLFYKPVGGASSAKGKGKEKGKEEGKKSSAVAKRDDNGEGSSKDKDKDKKKGKAKPVKVRMTARARRVARGSGTSVREVEEFLVQYR